MHPQQLLTSSQVASILATSPQVVLRMARKGEIPAVYLPGRKEPRFQPTALRQWLQALEQRTVDA